MNSTQAAVAAAAGAARAAVPALAGASEQTVQAALAGMAERLATSADAILRANAADYERADADGLSAALLDRLRVDADRLRGMADQLHVLAATADEPRFRVVREFDGTVVLEKRRPVGVVGATFEARPNVTLDMASQTLRSRNAAVLRTGSAALGTAAAIVDLVVAPALAAAGLPAGAVQLLRLPGRDGAQALVQHPEGIPLVIIRGSGDTTRHLARLAALAGVRALAHADGGGVLYAHVSADPARLRALVAAGLDRLGVCNRLNLLLIDHAAYDAVLPAVRAELAALDIALSEPPHSHPLGYEWALDPDRSATVTVAPVDGALAAAEVANTQTSGLAATVVAEDPDAATTFLGAYAGTGGFWNISTRLLDGYKLLAVPETGINVDRSVGPRGPVTFRDLYVRQYLTCPAGVADLITKG